MSRHYQVRRRIIQDRRERYALFDIVEVYTEHGIAVGHTYHAVAPVGRTLRELVDMLQEMLKDATRYGVLKEEHEQEARRLEGYSTETDGLSTPTKSKQKSKAAQLRYDSHEDYLREVDRRKEDGE